MVNRLFALATVTALVGAAAASSIMAGCTTTEIETVAGDAGDPGTKLGEGGTTSGGVRPGDDDDLGDAATTTTKTCLDPTPINPSTVPYEPPNAPVVGACTTAELLALSAYYKAHSTEASFSVAAWQGAVSPVCGACVFVENDDADPAQGWGPILVKNDQIDNVDLGGCIGTVSNNLPCGKVYQQYQECLVKACLSKCKTGADYDACRGDTSVLTTACKTAVAAVKTTCGNAVSSYEALCKGTSYTFEGPIKIGCISPPVSADAGATDAGPDAHP